MQFKDPGYLPGVACSISRQEEDGAAAINGGSRTVEMGSEMHQHAGGAQQAGQLEILIVRKLVVGNQ
jgi:hypothetical protein